MKILCIFGKYQYGDPDRGIGTEYAAFIPALKNLGHEVIHFESWNRNLYPDFARLNKALLLTIKKEEPDVLFTVQMNYEIWIETLKIIKDSGICATVSWTTDDSWKYREVSRFIGGSYHAMTTTYPDKVRCYKKDGIHNVLLTHWAAASDKLAEPLPSENCKYQVSFVGAAHGNRKKRIEYLKKNGIEVNCFGFGWPAGSIPAEDIPVVMRNSIISLNFSNSKGENQLKARTFEVPGAGGFLLTEYVKGLEDYYLMGQEIEVFHDDGELVDKIIYYLKNCGKRDEIAAKGYEKTCHRHTYENRMKEILSFTIECKKKWDGKKQNFSETLLDDTIKAYEPGRILNLIKNILIFFGVLIFGKKRGSRAARRLVFELSWRFCGKKTFSASGWPGRMFPEQ